MNSLAPWHIVVILSVGLVLFGSKRLPDSARSLGRSLRIFKSEMKELNKDETKPDQDGNSSTDK